MLREDLGSDPSRFDSEAEAEAWVGPGLHPYTVSCVYVRRLARMWELDWDYEFPSSNRGGE